ncbi:MAG TPA: SAM-dependent methyltransferase [Streptosporangiaceae bacterium]|jgi:O-methyltransferase involved in polyketide biosynthesis
MNTPSPSDESASSPVIDTSVSHSARIWNYWLGGKDNYPIDREVGDQVREVLPEIVDNARHDRAYLGRVVRYLTGEAGIRQYLDIGTGLPTADNTHEVAQRVAPETRIVYVDNDPLVLVHARALLTSSPEGATDYIDGDLRDPEPILERAANTLDFGRPVALMLLGVLHYLGDDEEAYATVNRLLDAVPSGSYLAIQHPTNSVTGTRMEEAVRRWNEAGGAPIYLRTPEQLAGFFDRLELLEPGVVSCSLWRPDHSPWGTPEAVDVFGAVGRKP